jgi:succinate dehydrogenase/fumarate reductase cytochrome b subunit
VKIAPYILLWFPLIGIGIFNGVLREATYGKRMSELRAHQLSSLIGTVLFYVAFHLILRSFPTASTAHAALVGLIWLLMTAAFEFCFGRWVAKHSWRRLLRDYDLAAGRLWGLVLLSIFLAPLVFHGLTGP